MSALDQINTALKYYNCPAVIKQLKHLCCVDSDGHLCTLRPIEATTMAVLHIDRTLAGAREFLSYASPKMQYLGREGQMSYYQVP